MNPAHRDHDELLVVRLASGDADVVDTRLAERQLTACQECQTLLVDISAIRSSTVADVLRVPSRPRSFRIPAAELERLRAPLWRRWLGRFGAPRFDLVRPFATAVAGLGLAVMVLGSALPAAGPGAFFQAAGATSAGAPEAPGASDLMSAPSDAGTEGAPSEAGGTPPRDSMGGYGAKSTSTPVPAPAIGLERDRTGIAGPTPLPVAPVGLVILGSGLALIVLNTVARRAAGR